MRRIPFRDWDDSDSKEAACHVARSLEKVGKLANKSARWDERGKLFLLDDTNAPPIAPPIEAGTLDDGYGDTVTELFLQVILFPMLPIL